MRRAAACLAFLALLLPMTGAHAQTYSYSVLMDTDVDLHGEDLGWIGLLSVNDSDTVAASVEFVSWPDGGVFTPSQALIKTGDVIDSQTVVVVGNAGGGYGINNSGQIATFAHMETGTGSRPSIVKADPIPSQNRIIAQHEGPTVCGLTIGSSMSHPRNSNVDAVVFQAGYNTGSGPSQANFKLKASDSTCLDHVKIGDTVDGLTITGFEHLSAGGFAINDTGDWTFFVTYSGGQGIVFVDAQTGHAKSFVQKTGEVVAGRTIERFIQSAFLGDTGEILYIAEFVGGGQGLISAVGPARALLVESGDVIGCREIETFVTAAANTAGSTVFLAKLVGGPTQYGAFTLTSRIAATGDVVAGAAVQTVDEVTIGETGHPALALTFPASRKAMVLATPTGPPVGCCGNGQPDPGEECDDANANNNDVCTNGCQNAECGDGILGPGDECDDGNPADSDGCSGMCEVEPGWVCPGEPSVCISICGDGLLRGGEECDDGNTLDDDCCSSMCTLESGCTCTGEPSTCTLCGNGIVQGSEECDLGPASPDSGNCPADADPPMCTSCTRSCSSTCQLIGRCTGSAECCTSAADCPVGEGCCGNGTVESGELCDDGNTLGGDTCTPVCTPDVDYPPIACCPRGSEVAGSTVAANRKLKLTRMDKPVGDQRFNSPGETVLLPGQSIHPCTEAVTYCLESNSGPIYSSRISGSAFGPKPPCLDAGGRLRAIFKDKTLTDSDPDGLKRVQFKNSSSQTNRIKHQVQGQSVDLSPAIGAAQLRQTLVVGDTCMTSVLTCDAGAKTKKCVPVP